MGAIFGCVLLGSLVYWARQDGKKAERLAALKREIKEVQRVQNLTNHVRCDTIERVRGKLQQIK